MTARIWMALIALTFAGYAFGGGFLQPGLTEEEFDKKVDAGPVVKPLVKTYLEALPAGTKIEVYYKRFGILHLAHNPNAENAHHFIMGKPGNPSWKYLKIAEIEIHRAMRADPIVIAAMKKEAVIIGGDALTDCHRDPVFLEAGMQQSPDRRQTYMEIVGYRFFCSVVRRKG